MALVALQRTLLTLFTVVVLSPSLSFATPTSACQFTFRDGNKLYNYTLYSPIRNFPHGILSEDGVKFMREWSSNRVITAGYHVCSAIGHGPTFDIDVIDKKSPHTGIIVKMSSGSLKYNCSLAVSVLCNLNGVQGPQTLERSGDCNYATELKHPSGCAMIVNVHGSGWGWFGTLLIILLCLFAAYLLAGIVYRYFVLKIRGIEVIPNLDFWISLPKRIQSQCSSLVRKFKGPSEGHRSSYSAVNF
ncbi:hypothetical protein KIW84_053815 [Lathyrus oleraceus]|uniref:Autophagy-related protein 27 n=1 Tax=Pisum sativum TaxID=3888 RepID=A0A9D4WRE8_PEA|nr:hypothetical protein KIW84_053815 [Pisum sativum]